MIFKINDIFNFYVFKYYLHIYKTELLHSFKNSIFLKSQILVNLSYLSKIIVLENRNTDLII